MLTSLAFSDSRDKAGTVQLICSQVQIRPFIALKTNLKGYEN